MTNTKGLGGRAVADLTGNPPTPTSYGSGSYGWNACFMSSHRLVPGKPYVWAEKVGASLSTVRLPAESIMIGLSSLQAAATPRSAS